MAVYPSEFGIQRMKEEEIYGPVGLFDDEDDRNEDYLDEKQDTLGEILNGDRLVTAPYEVKFLQGKDQEVACAKKLTSEEVSQIQATIKQFYIFQMYCDDLPIWGYIGKVEESPTNISEHKYLLYQHFEIEIFFNKDQIIEAHLLMHPNEVVELAEGRNMDIELQFSVHWMVLAGFL
ncbi:hypothetical protein EUGRSUZ_C02078 [Eucalyptus grandis]|uniref:Transmembrane 9 superfamily member n=3 Tax=Eucalyptus TaxID=3932 RepID=A0A059CR39_EUCGR|nr:hypothetical protein EUGRSUZ_C02078 [Eucalyptus grandis]